MDKDAAAIIDREEEALSMLCRVPLFHVNSRPRRVHIEDGSACKISGGPLPTTNPPIHTIGTDITTGSDGTSELCGGRTAYRLGDKEGVYEIHLDIPFEETA